MFTFLKFLDLKDVCRLLKLSKTWKKEIIGHKYNHVIQDIWYWQNMDNKIMLRLVKIFKHFNYLEIRKCNYLLST